MWMKIRDINVGLRLNIVPIIYVIKNDRINFRAIRNLFRTITFRKSGDGHEYAVTDYATFVPYIYGRLMPEIKTYKRN